jgi:uncharacterized membrane protein
MLSYLSIIVFIHVLSAVIWIGGMIAIRFAVHYSIQTIEDPKIKLEKTLENLKRFFYLVIPSILSLFITAIIMIISFKLNETPNHYIVVLKELIWTIMTIIFIIIYIERNIAQKALENNDFLTAKKHLIPIAKYFIPTNIILGVIAIFFGIILRGI